MKVHERIRQLRVIKNISQKAIADDLNLSLTGYRKIETGEVDISTKRLQQIADYFEIPAWKLLLDDEEPSADSLKEPVETYLKKHEQLLNEQREKYEAKLEEKDREISRLIALLDDCMQDNKALRKKV